MVHGGMRVSGTGVRTGLTFEGCCVGGVLPPLRCRASLQRVGGVVLHKCTGLEKPRQSRSCGAKAPFWGASDPGRRGGYGTPTILQTRHAPACKTNYPRKVHCCLQWTGHALQSKREDMHMAASCMSRPSGPGIIRYMHMTDLHTVFQGLQHAEAPPRVLGNPAYNLKHPQSLAGRQQHTAAAHALDSVGVGPCFC